MLLLASSLPAMADPTMDDTMKQAKIMPCGMRSPFGLRAGECKEWTGGAVSSSM